MQRTDAHLVELAREAQGDAAGLDEASFQKLRTAAGRVLSRSEFRTVTGPTWWERRIAQLQDWLSRLFSGVGRVGARLPWLAAAIEWGCFALAAAGLLWFLWRSLARQALRVSLSEAGPLAGWNQRDSADWRQTAEQQAAAGQWREATHSLYWAGVALLESRRAWRPNSTRTPREYLRLLKPGSAAREGLAELTRSLETAWYGRLEIGEAQYRTAQASFARLEQTRPERGTAEDPNRSGIGFSAAESG